MAIQWHPREIESEIRRWNRRNGIGNALNQTNDFEKRIAYVSPIFFLLSLRTFALFSFPLKYFHLTGRKCVKKNFFRYRVYIWIYTCTILSSVWRDSSYASLLCVLRCLWLFTFINYPWHSEQKTKYTRKKYRGSCFLPGNRLAETSHSYLFDARGRYITSINISLYRLVNESMYVWRQEIYAKTNNLDNVFADVR